ncbi:hypothetical protein [Magnetospirillum moscoviense]|uniref:hypothetical protein n=1 Tax=Magnetospirillum moscoviense TaxID=1437059 RepID=UPI000A640AF0|nr:hypothetical protein [Magnetospirillum moscoviense]
MLTLVVAKGFMGKLLANPEIAAHLDKHHGDLAVELRRVVDTMSEEAPSAAEI